LSLARTLVSVVACGVVALACAGGGVAPYMACTPGDMCMSGTVCESASADSSTVGPTFCTHSCTSDADCPADETGAKGVCTATLDADTGDVAFCYRSCERGSCPSGSTCVETLDELHHPIKACQPDAVDALGATAWTSTAPLPNGSAITQATYAMKFGPSTTVQGGATGAFDATFVQVFDANASMYAGCTETTTFAGATYVEVASSSTEGVLEIQGGTATNDRSGCDSWSDDVTGEGAYTYIEEVESFGATPFTIADRKMTIQGGTGVVPLGEKVPWTFTRQ